MLYLIATPIGNAQDISLRALELLKNTPYLIIEERKEGAAFLRQHGILLSEKKFDQLNEHSTPEDLQRMTKLCKQEDVVLITDCGTPGFADPGADLVRECRKLNIPVRSVPGASSLMTLLSLSSQRLTEFVFRGFLSNESQHRQDQLKSLASEKRAIVLMDTPYRLQRTVQDVAQYFPQRKILLTLNLTQENEFVIECTGEKLLAQLQGQDAKAEFMMLIYPTSVKS
jgi:16S rRNA (cytidine1402-2'-O)-methyltransferase